MPTDSPSFWKTSFNVLAVEDAKSAIRNTGWGMTKQNLMHLFERFLNWQRERHTSGDLTLTGAAGGGYGGGKVFKIPLAYISTKCKLDEGYMVILNRQEAGVYVTTDSVYVNIGYTDDDFATETFMASMVEVDNTTSLHSLTVDSTTEIPAGALLFMEVSVPNAKLFAGKFDVSVVRTSIDV